MKKQINKLTLNKIKISKLDRDQQLSVYAGRGRSSDSFEYVCDEDEGGPIK